MNQPPSSQTNYSGWAEKRKFNPLKIALISLPVIFIIYQGMGSSLVALFSSIFGWDITESLRIGQGLTQYLFLLLPVIFLVRLHTASVRDYTFLRNEKLGIGFLLIPLSVIVFQPVMQFLSFYERMIEWPEAILYYRDLMENMMRQMVDSSSITELLFVIFVTAVTPAICEEFYFRGYILRNFSRVLKPASAVILSGVIFGLFHINPFQISGLILMGVFFSFLAWQYQSLWASMLAHLVNNFMVVMAYYISKEELIGMKLDDPNLQIPLSLFLSSTVLFAIIVWLIIRSTAIAKSVEK